MSLDTARFNLTRALDDPRYLVALVKEWPKASKTILEWWDEYKAWERADTLEKAFNDHRLTARYYKRAFDAQLDMMAKKGEGGEQVAFPGHKVAVGLQWLGEYTKPDNFLPVAQGMTRRKIELGLYDQSARLLDGRRKISEQVFGKIAEGHLYSFSPLSDPDDQVAFHHLNEVGKKLRNDNTELYTLVREIRSKMTRIKLAQETDMGTNYTATKPEDSVNPKFKYGISRTTTMPKDSKPTAYSEQQAEDILKGRRLTALNFKGILIPQKGNEITVAYRQHAGMFPIIGKWRKSEGRIRSHGHRR